VSYQKIEQYLKLSWYRRIPIIAAVFTIALMVDEINQSLFLVLNSVLYIPFEFIWLNISILGEAQVIAILLLPLIARRPNILWAVLITFIITITSVELAKHYFAQPRPPVVLDYDQFHQIGENFSVDSFPSVNAAVAFSIAAIVLLSVQQLWLKITIIIYAFLIGLSQIAIGANWPIDIFAGVIAGWLPAKFGFDLAKKKIFKTKTALKFLRGLFITIVIYFIYDLVTGDINVAVLKTVILITCVIIAYPDIRKIIDRKLKTKAKKINKKTKVIK